jgi:predicted dehydrogenase
MTNGLRCGVIGAGWWGTEAHIPAFKRHSRADLVAVHHRDQDKAEMIAADFDIPHAFSDVDELLRLNGLNAVAISSTPNVHFAHAKAALSARICVLLEKPMTIRAHEARELVELADEECLEFVISAPWHYTPHAAEAQRIIMSGELGEIKMISVLMTNFTLGFLQGKSWGEMFPTEAGLEMADTPYLPPEPESAGDPEVSGGGQIYNQIAHVAAFLSFLTGQSAAEVHARFDNFGLNVDLYNTLNVKLEGGTLVSIASTGNTMFPERNFEIRIYGSEGMMFFELWRGQLRCRFLDGRETRFDDLTEEEIYPKYAPAENLIDAALGIAPNRSPAVLGARAMDLIEAACESAKSGANVVIQ